MMPKGNFHTPSFDMRYANRQLERLPHIKLDTIFRNVNVFDIGTRRHAFAKIAYAIHRDATIAGNTLEPCVEADRMIHFEA